MTKKFLLVVLLVLLFANAVAWLWFLHGYGGATHREIVAITAAEGAATRAKVIERCDAMDVKLDRIESKLDRLILLATPSFPDGMKAAE